MISIVFQDRLNINKSARPDATLRNPSETLPEIYMKREQKDIPVLLWRLFFEAQPSSVILKISQWGTERGRKKRWMGKDKESWIKWSCQRAPLKHICMSRMHSRSTTVGKKKMTKNDVEIRRARETLWLALMSDTCSFLFPHSALCSPGAAICFTKCMREILETGLPHERINNTLPTLSGSSVVEVKVRVKSIQLRYIYGAYRCYTLFF